MIKRSELAKNTQETQLNNDVILTECPKSMAENPTEEYNSLLAVTKAQIAQLQNEAVVCSVEHIYDKNKGTPQQRLRNGESSFYVDSHADTCVIRTMHS